MPKNDKNALDLAVVGGGAAGLAAAIEYARTVRKYGLEPNLAVFERNPKTGKKLLATGNGRCNLGNRQLSPANYGNNAFAQFALKAYDTESTEKFFRSLGVLCRGDDFGRLYPMNNQASSVSDALRAGAQSLGVKIITDCKTEEIEKIRGGFLLGGYSAKSVILACGGKAAKAHGSDGSGYALAKSLGHSITPLFPSLVPLTARGGFFKSLKGIRTAAKIDLICGKKVFEGETGEIQFTEYGISGIAVMQLSGIAGVYLSKGITPIITADLAPSLTKAQVCDFLFEARRENPEYTAAAVLTGILHKSLARVILKNFAEIPPEAKIGSIKKVHILKIADIIKKTEFEITGTKGFDFAQVTKGGANCREFSDKTMMSKLCPNLFAAGELLDVDGMCGGYNLQWAWASGRLAGKSAAERILKAYDKN